LVLGKGRAKETPRGGYVFRVVWNDAFRWRVISAWAGKKTSFEKLHHPLKPSTPTAMTPNGPEGHTAFLCGRTLETAGDSRFR